MLREMARPKLTYFDFAGGRGEDCRIALFLAGVDFEDDRVTFSQWPERKAQTPFGALPVLEIPGEGVLAQSNAILRLIGTRHGLHPKGEFEAARHEALMEAVEDMRAKLTPTLRIKDEAKKKAAREDLARTYLPGWASNIERQIESQPFLAGEALSVADLKLSTAVRWIASGTVDHITADVFADAPKLLALADAVAEHPGVKRWYAR